MHLHTYIRRSLRIDYCLAFSSAISSISVYGQLLHFTLNCRVCELALFIAYARLYTRACIGKLYTHIDDVSTAPVRVRTSSYSGSHKHAYGYAYKSDRPKSHRTSAGMRMRECLRHSFAVPTSQTIYRKSAREEGYIVARD